MPLTGSEIKEMQNALLSAFPQRTKLAQFLRTEMDVTLAQVVGVGDDSDAVFELVTWAEAAGRTEELIRKAHETVPGNKLLKACVEKHLCRQIDTTRQKYLTYLIERHGFLHPSGIMQTERDVTLPLDRVYVSLTADRVRQTIILTREEYRKIGHELIENAWRQYELPEREKDRGEEKVTLHDAMRNERRLVVLGDPGAGKTTLTKFLTYRFATACQEKHEKVEDREGNDYGTPRLPIWLRVAEYADARKQDKTLKIRPYLSKAFQDVAATEAEIAAMLYDALDNGKAFVILDGLDEVTDTGDRIQIARNIEAFVAGVHRDNRFLVTSRIAGYVEARLSGGFTQITMRDMDGDQREAFLIGWCLECERFHTQGVSEEELKRRADTQLRGILDAIEHNEGVRRLAGNPLLLTILALIYRTGARLPSRRVELYDLATRTLLKNWRLAQTEGRTPVVEEHEALRLLGPLAYEMHRREVTGLISEKRAQVILTEHAAKMYGKELDDPELILKVDDFLRRVREHSGILVERAPGQLGFLHLTFEEYFAGRELLRPLSEAKRKIHKLRHRARWEEPIRLAIAFLSRDYSEEAADIIRTAILAITDAVEFHPSAYEDLLYRDKIMAAKCLCDCEGLDVQLLEVVLNPLMEIVLEQTERGLIPSLWEQCVEAVRGLNSVTEKIVPFLLSVMQNTEANEGIRQSAAWMLGQLDPVSDAVVLVLFSILQNPEEDKSIRESTAWVLVELGQESEEVALFLLSMMQDTKGNRMTRERAARALGRLGRFTDTVLSFWLSSIQNREEDGMVIERAVWALRELEQANEIVISALVTMMQNPDEGIWIRGIAARALGDLGQATDEVISALLLVMQNKEEDLWVQMSTASALGELGQNSDKVNSFLLSIVNNSEEDNRIRDCALEALGEAGQATKEVVSALLSVIRDKKGDWELRVSAALILGKLKQKNKAAISILLSVIQNPEEDKWWRQEAASALVHLDQEREAVISFWLSVMLDINEEEKWRRKAATNLGQLCQTRQDVCNILEEAIKAPGDFVEDEAWNALLVITRNREEEAEKYGA